MKAIRFERFGEPSEVLRCEEVPTPEPGPNQVLVRMLATPVNPSDLLVVRGRYGVLPTLPATPGFEGVGIVEKSNGPIGRLFLGKRVAIIGGNATWAEYAVVPALRVVPVADAIDDVQAASFFVNPATVLGLVNHVLKVPKGAWLMQSAAGSTLGRMVISLGKHQGFKTLNLVRRRAAVEELKALGGDAVISTEDGPIDEQVKAIVGDAGIKYAIDPVGGETGTQIIRSMGHGGRLVCYGSLSEDPIRLESRRLIIHDARVEGFWLGHWMQSRSKLKAIGLFREISAMIRQGILRTEPGREFGLEAILEAAGEADSVGRKGKALLRISSRG